MSIAYKRGLFTSNNNLIIVDNRDLAQEDNTLFLKEIYKDKEEERFVIKVDKESSKKIIKQESIKREKAIF